MGYETDRGENSRTETQESRPRPVDEVRFGRVKIVVWQNQTKNGDMLSFKPVRIYKDGEEWKETQSLGVGDLLPMAMALEEAFRRASSPNR